VDGGLLPVVLLAFAAILALPLTVWIFSRHVERTQTVGGTPRDLAERNLRMQERKLELAAEAQQERSTRDALSVCRTWIKVSCPR
jgi:hypothetical protein